MVNPVTWNRASNTKSSGSAVTPNCARNTAAPIIPPVFPATLATGSGILFTRKVIAPIFFSWLSTLALTFTTTSLPMAEAGTETEYLPFPSGCNEQGAVMEAEMLSNGTPAAATVIGFGTPAYSTFILSADTDTDEAPTIYEPVAVKVFIWPFRSFRFTATV